MQIRPLRAYESASWPKVKLDPNREYAAVPATNQPQWDDKGKIFVLVPGAQDMLLEAGEYEVTG